MPIPAKFRAPGWYRAALYDVLGFGFAFGLTVLIRWLMHEHPVIDGNAITIVALIAAYQAAKDADVDLQSLLISMGADKHQVFFKAVVPSTLPSIIATFRINIGFGLVGAVVGEFISSQRGLGHLIYTASSLYDLNTVWVGLFTLMIMGFVLYYVIDLVERTTLPWFHSAATPPRSRA